MIGAFILFINIQVGLNMHLYDDIGDASSSLRGSTSIFIMLAVWYRSNYRCILFFVSIFIGVLSVWDRPSVRRGLCLAQGVECYPNFLPSPSTE